MQNMVEEGEPETDSNQSLSIHGSSSLALPIVNQPELEKGSDDVERGSKSDDSASSNRSLSESIMVDSYTMQETITIATVEQDADEEWLVFDDGVPFPVPRLVSLPQEQTGEAEEENHSATENTSKTENPTENELTAMEAREKLERDLQWAKKTILKFLANFGFQ